MIHFNFVTDDSVVLGLFVGFLSVVDVSVTRNNNAPRLLAESLSDSVMQ